MSTDHIPKGILELVGYTNSYNNNVKPLCMSCSLPSPSLMYTGSQFSTLVLSSYVEGTVTVHVRNLYP